MIDPWKIDFRCQAICNSFNGAVFIKPANPRLGIFFREEIIRDFLVASRSQHSPFYNPLNDFEVSEHSLITALGACREFRERKLLTDQHSLKIK